LVPNPSSRGDKQLILVFLDVAGRRVVLGALLLPLGLGSKIGCSGHLDLLIKK
jgi:hypothetical protein